jgi:hypothetical protein
MLCSYFYRVEIFIWLFFYCYRAKVRSFPNFYIFDINCYSFYSLAFTEVF